MTWLELVQDYFPEVDNKKASYILGHTSFPIGGDAEQVEAQIKVLACDAGNND
jgi:hypothetical protein